THYKQSQGSRIKPIPSRVISDIIKASKTHPDKRSHSLAKSPEIESQESQEESQEEEEEMEEDMPPQDNTVATDSINGTDLSQNTLQYLENLIEVKKQKQKTEKKRSEKEREERDESEEEECSEQSQQLGDKEMKKKERKRNRSGVEMKKHV
ncbi:hypothetical protein ADUPG1_005005, partial [Aduncisulcus paluster]